MLCNDARNDAAHAFRCEKFLLLLIYDLFTAVYFMDIKLTSITSLSDKASVLLFALEVNESVISMTKVQYFDNLRESCGFLKCSASQEMIFRSISKFRAWHIKPERISLSERIFVIIIIIFSLINSHR